MFQRPPAYVFVDGGYMAKLNLEFGGRIDLPRFLDKVCEPNYRRKRTYWFDALPWKGRDPTPEQQKRFENKRKFLERLEYIDRTEVQLGKVEPRFPLGGGAPVFVQKQVDVLLSLKLVVVAFKGDAEFLILIAGDSDLVPAVVTAKDAGATVILFYADIGNVRTHKALMMAADERVEITREYLADVMLS